MPEPSDIPVGTQFSPNLIDLKAFLRELVRHSGDRDALLDAIWKPNVRIKRPKSEPTTRQKSLPLEAAIQYGLLESDGYEATELTKELAELPGEKMYEEFARHVLLNLGGLRVLEGIQQMKADNLNVTGDSLARFLTQQGFRVTEHNTAINSLRLWLAQAGIFPHGGSRAWDIDTVRKQELLDLDDEEIALLADLTLTQREFVKALCAVDPDGWYPAAEIRDLAETRSQVRFGRQSLPKAVLDDLERIGIIEFRTKGTGGGKTSELRTTEEFNKEVLEPFVANAVEDLDGAVSAYYRKRPDDIYAELGSEDNATKGRALEAYAIHVMRLLGLRFMGWQRRAKDTGYAEVDVVLAGMLGGVPTRWQVQCKNKPSKALPLEDVAKEVGLTPLTGATHILFLTNSKITREARKYANEIMRHSSLTIFLLGTDEFEKVKESPAHLGPIIRSMSETILTTLQQGKLFRW